MKSVSRLKLWWRGWVKRRRRCATCRTSAWPSRRTSRTRRIRSSSTARKPCHTVLAIRPSPNSRAIRNYRNNSTWTRHPHAGRSGIFWCNCDIVLYFCYVTAWPLIMLITWNLDKRMMAMRSETNMFELYLRRNVNGGILTLQETAVYERNIGIRYLTGGWKFGKSWWTAVLRSRTSYSRKLARMSCDTVVNDSDVAEIFIYSIRIWHYRLTFPKSVFHWSIRSIQIWITYSINMI